MTLDISPWIFTAERMPVFNEDVLLVLPVEDWNPNVLIGYHNQTMNAWSIDTRYGVQYVPLGKVHLWMPVPAAPTLQQRADARKAATT